MVFVQKWPLFQPVFLGNIGKENVFHDTLAEKKSFQAIKTRSSKSRKTDIFPNGLTHRFGPILGNIGQENVFHDILQQKKLLSTL